MVIETGFDSDVVQMAIDEAMVFDNDMVCGRPKSKTLEKIYTIGRFINLGGFINKICQTLQLY